MRRVIDTAPRDGKFVILEDDVSGRFESAQWSAEARGWVRKNGEPSEITPTHWQTMHLPKEGDEFILQDELMPPKETGSIAPPASPGPRSFCFPSGLAERARVTELTRLVTNADPVTGVLVEARGAQSKRERGRTARRAISSIAAVMVGASLVGWYFHAEFVAYVTRHIGEEDNVRPSIADVEAVKKETQVPSEDQQKADSSARDPALHQQADRAIAQAPRDTAQGKQAAEAMQPEVQQSSSERERRRAEALANELARAQQIIEMQIAWANKARDQATQLSQAAESGMAELRQSLQKEHDRAEALAGELAKARRDIETQLALPSKARDQAAQRNQAAEKATPELRQSLKQERAEAPTPGRETTPTQATMVAAMEQPAVAEAQGGPEAARLLARASALLGQGDIGAARIVLERAVETGSARASFMLAETYDPLVLATWKTYGTRGDLTKARELYAKALAGGIQEAKGRSVALH
ncbi:hypothetical protein HU675_0028870 [Bradyrhizobium septentrionale]|uniref:hypothetical protein n=1 Tax=Bradyrhizobium septentrionale TaxID=1404411 RepID=UPI0015971317|nr:hypothetical protein [Bradyrhizobium septentrionale]UGY22009.1 hypothetical protein HU675_0028870 [Bradyrhizobium septentrionale]